MGLIELKRIQNGAMLSYEWNSSKKMSIFKNWLLLTAFGYSNIVTIRLKKQTIKSKNKITRLDAIFFYFKWTRS